MDIGEILLDEGKLSPAELAQARQVHDGHQGGLGPRLVRLGLIAEQDLARAYVQHLALPRLEESDLPGISLDEERLSPKFLKEALVLPLGGDAESMYLAMADPQDDYARQAVALACGREVHPLVATVSEVERGIERLYGEERSALADIVDEIDAEEDDGGDSVERLRDLAAEAPIVRLVNLLIDRAIQSRASDIHIEPFEDRLRVRYRIDGVLQEVEAPPAHSTAAVGSRIKLMAKLNIAERRLPQDGRIQLRAQGRRIDLRVSTVPTLHGESLVLRILDKEQVELDFAALGFRDEEIERFSRILSLPHGIVLSTGPTGSGKTTTLYAALAQLNTPVRKILTVEDPIEYQIEGINQIQVKPGIGLGFAEALRSIVRQDPDVIMIGEMRDLETARIAVQSALTGHLVFSTLHTNDAGSAVTRLLDMGVEDYLLTSTLNCILSQRLVRTLCMHCRQPHDGALPEAAAQPELERALRKGTLYRAAGCARCAHTGYAGRTVIQEMLVLSPPIRRLILEHADGSEIQRAAMEHGMRNLRQSGLGKAALGITSLDEVLRVT